MLVHIGFVNSYTEVTTNGIIYSWLVKATNMTMHLGFVNLCITVVYDHNITNYISKTKMTAHRI